MELLEWHVMKDVVVMAFSQYFIWTQKKRTIISLTVASFNQFNLIFSAICPYLNTYNLSKDYKSSWHEEFWSTNRFAAQGTSNMERLPVELHHYDLSECIFRGEYCMLCYQSVGYCLLVSRTKHWWVTPNIHTLTCLLNNIFSFTTNWSWNIDIIYHPMDLALCCRYVGIYHFHRKGKQWIFVMHWLWCNKISSGNCVTANILDLTGHINKIASSKWKLGCASAMLLL